MKQFDFYPLIIFDGIEPSKYDVLRKEVSPCQETLIVTAYYKCQCCATEKQKQFNFYLWKMPTNRAGVYERSLSCFETIACN